MVGFWYNGRGDAMGVMDMGYATLYIWAGIGGCEPDELGLEYTGVEGMGGIC